MSGSPDAADNDNGVGESYSYIFFVFRRSKSSVQYMQ